MGEAVGEGGSTKPECWMCRDRDANENVSEDELTRFLVSGNSGVLEERDFRLWRSRCPRKSVSKDLLEKEFFHRTRELLRRHVVWVY